MYRFDPVRAGVLRHPRDAHTTDMTHGGPVRLPRVLAGCRAGPAEPSGPGPGRRRSRGRGPRAGPSGPPAAHDRRVGQVEHRPVRQLEEVHDVARGPDRGAEDPVDAGCRRRRRAPARARPPTAVLRSRRDSRRMTTTTAAATTVNAMVSPWAKPKAAPALRTSRSVSRPPSSVDRLAVAELANRQHLGGEVGERAPGRPRPPAAAAAGCRPPGGSVALAQRRSSRCLHVMHSVARGNTCRRALPMGLPQFSQTP